MALRLENIGYTYGQASSVVTRALAQVSLTVEAGELVLIIGATGSGKSTLLRVCAGLLEPQTGAVSVDAVPLTAQSARGAVGLVFQDAESQLFAETVLDDVSFGPANLGATPQEAADAARRALDAVGLPAAEFGLRSPFSLSGGEARRAAIAGVIAMEPAYLLADEPTAGLDADGRKAVRELLVAVREKAGVVVVSHSAEEFLGHADRVLVLMNGECAWYGDAPSLIADPRPFERAGLIAPDVLAVQMLVADRAGDSLGHTLDPEAAARSLALATGWLS